MEFQLGPKQSILVIYTVFIFFFQQNLCRSPMVLFSKLMDQALLHYCLVDHQSCSVNIVSEGEIPICPHLRVDSHQLLLVDFPSHLSPSSGSAHFKRICSIYDALIVLAYVCPKWSRM